MNEAFKELNFVVTNCVHFKSEHFTGVLYISVSFDSRDEPVKKQQYSDDDDFDEQERERMKDLKERDEFADRMKNKDKEKTRQIMSKSEKKVTALSPHGIPSSDFA